MRYDWEGMSLWFEPNEIASDRTILAGTEVTITVGVEPADASNRVEVCYRVNGGPTAIAVADPVRHARHAQYFRARLPATAFRAGDSVEYTALCRCAGRQVPSPEEAEHFALSFHVVEAGTTGTPDHSALDGASRHATRDVASPGLPATARFGAAAHSLTPDPAFAPAPMTGFYQATFVVCGQVQAHGIPVGGVRVRAFDKALRREQPLGETTTNEDGRYELRYTAEQFPQAKGRHANLLVRAFNVAGVELGASEITFNAPATATIDLALTRTDDVQPSEYDRLLSVLTPFLGDVALADLTDDDVTFLTQATQIDRQSLELLHQSARLGVQTGLPTAAFFGFGRAGLSLDLETLVAFQNNGLRHAITSAVDKKFIPKTLQEQSDTFIRRLKRYNYVPHQVTGQLLDQQTGAPLAGVTVRMFDVNTSGDPEALSSVTTDGKGMFTFSYAAPPTKPANSTMLQFLCKISDAKGQVLAEHKVQIAPGQTDEVEVRIAVPAPYVPPSPTISHLSSTLHLSIPTGLQSSLSKRNISTLEDIRRTGGLAQLVELPIAPDQSAVQMLEAHADLSRLSPDAQVNASLIEKGYTNVAAIADAPLEAFVAATTTHLGDFKAARLHAVARAQTGFLDNLVTGLGASRDQPSATEVLYSVSILPGICGCDDCEAAVSPAAYLVELLAYTLKHVQNFGEPITPELLESAFHQPFGGLPTDCHAVNQRVRQVRICVEVLRDCLKTVPLTPKQTDALNQAEHQYRLSAYLSLLNQNGTSYTEIRSARTATEVQRRALADKLGIALSSPRLPGGDELDRLFLDDTAVPGNPSALTEQAIERLFGLPDTTRDPLSTGAKFGDDVSSPHITRWRLTGVKWGRNTDPNGYVFFSQGKHGTNVELYKDSQRQNLVAQSGPDTGLGTTKLFPQNASDLSGVLEIASMALSSAIAISAVPELLSWRLRYLRTLWSLQDRPADAYADDAKPVLPLVDPDLLGPDDFRVPFPKASPSAQTKAYDLWLVRRAFVDQTLDQLEQNRQAQGLAFILQQVLGTPGPMPDLDALLQAVSNGSKTEVESATSAIQALNLQVDEFLRLMTIRAKEQSATSDKRNDPVSDAEWRDVYSILAQATKRLQFATWRKEEHDANVDLGPQEFWHSVREPVEGDWPPLRAAGVPLIDPDLQTVRDLPEYAAGAQAVDARNQRRDALIQIAASLKSARESNALTGFETMLRLAIGFPNPGDPLQHNLDTLRTQLASNNPIIVAAAQTAITNDFHLSLWDFNRLMDVRDKDRQTDLTKKPIASEYAAVYTLLTTARKVQHEYPKWLDDEVTRFGPEAVPLNEDVAYWKARKAALPRWRASADARQLWQQALQTRSGPPAIDPDLLTEEDLRDPFPLHVAFDILQTRKKFVEDSYTSVVSAPRTLATFDAIIESTVGIKATEFIGIDSKQQNGAAIQGRLDQLNLSNRAFSFLVSIRALLIQGQPVLDAEWQQCASILAQVTKERQFSTWQTVEQTNAIIVAPDFFLLVSNPKFADPAALDPWRAPWDRRRTWQETLQSRIDQENDVAAAMRDANSAVEGAHLPALRDALVTAAGPAGTTHETSSTLLADQLLIAMDDDGYEETTRIEQALETLQGLIFALKSGQFKNGIEFSDISAVSWGTGRIDLFVVGPDNGLWHRWFDQSQWYTWESLGGQLQFGPAVVSRGVGQLDVFACGRDNQLIWKSFANGVWADWVPLGGIITASPAAASAAPGRIDIFVRGSDGSLYSYAIQDNVPLGWQPPLGGYFNSGPAAASALLGQIDVFVWGGDNTLYRHVIENNVSLGWQPPFGLGGAMSAHPAAVSPTLSRVDVFVRGTDNTLQHYAIESEALFLASWQEGLGGYLATPPAVASPAIGQLNVFVRGGNGVLYANEGGIDGTWTGWKPIDSFAFMLVDLTNFEEEWIWIGSYATWRSAMFVFLYPENLCAPSLKRRYTPGFGNLTAKIRGARALTEEQACELAQEYATSYEDIAKLRIEASCEAEANTNAGTKCAPMQTGRKRLVFLFGRGGMTSRPYWSTYDTEDPSGFAQAFWDAIPGIEAVHQIVSAMVYEISPTERRIYVFIRTTEDLLQFLTFDLETLSWSDLKDLGLPPGSPADIKVVGNYWGSGIPPQLVLWAPASDTYYARLLNKYGTGWEDGDWNRFALDLSAQQRESPVSDLYAAINWDVYVRHESNKDIIVVNPGYVTYESGSEYNNAEFIGVVEILGYGSVLFQRLINGDINVSDQGAVGGFPLPGLNRIAPHTKPDRGKYAFVYAYERKNRAVWVPEVDGLYLRYDNSVDPGQQVQGTLIAPRALSFIDDQFSIPSKPDEGTIASRRTNIELVYKLGGDSGTNRTYPSEAYYFVPIALAQALQASGEYEAALDWFRTVYDYTVQVGQRKAYYGLVLEESLPDLSSRSDDWLLDPLDPHAIAGTRRNTYTRYTIQAIVRCLLDYADAEFTRDTSESNARARALYRSAAELLSAPEMAKSESDCKELVEGIDIVEDTAPAYVTAGLAAVTRRLMEIKDYSALSTAVNKVRGVLSSDADWPTRLNTARRLADQAIQSAKIIRPIGAALNERNETRKKAFSRLLSMPRVDTILTDLATRSSARFTSNVASFLSLPIEELEAKKGSLPWFVNPGPMAATETLIKRLDGLGTRIAPPLMEPSDDAGTTSPKLATPSLIPSGAAIPPFLSTYSTYLFCIPPNPIIESLRTHVRLNLYKLSSGRDITGLKRVVEPYAVPTDPVSGLPTVSASGQLVLPGTITITPTPYRYAVLIERAKQLVQIAAQMETSMLSAIEKHDAEAYSLLKARQDLKLADASVQLQALRQKQAGDSVTLAQSQQARAQLQVQHFQELLDKGESQLEKDAITYLGEAADKLADASTFAFMSAGATIAAGAIQGFALGGPAGAVEGGMLGAMASPGAIAQGLSLVAGKYSTRATILSTLASYERRQEEWQFSKALAQQDVIIGSQQVTIANDQVDIVNQEKAISDIQASNAKDTVAFLNNKFTNTDLYEWMSGVLQNVYSFFLRQATATAKLAENQLAFQRQETPSGFIQSDYWNATADMAAPSSLSSTGLDRRGLTGSARLLQDIYKLDDYAFTTNKRKLQIAKTFSLARLAPSEFQQFRETGLLRVVTRMEMFDRDFPGHYLRLISRVRISVIGLIPPNEGIHATLASTGLSRVVIGGYPFQTSVIRRDPESIALSSPINASGIFELDQASADMLLPFEGCGVDAVWEFRLPKASNLFDYNTIADVLMTFEYTALDSFDYRQQVIQSLDTHLSADAPFSFRNQFADQWYDLHNPDQTSTPMTVRFTTLRQDFPPNIDDLKIQQVLLYFSRADGQTFEVPVTSLRFTAQGGTGSVGGGATSIDGVISTRRGNAGSWMAMIDKAPFGDWELVLPQTDEMKNRFNNEDITDILFVVTYSGRTPEWPS